MSTYRYSLLLTPLFFFVFQLNAQNLADSVIIKRTDYGVPHIHSKNIKAGGYAMGYVQMEDYDSTVVAKLIKARGEWTKYHDVAKDNFNKEIDEDALNRLYYKRAVETFPRLTLQTRKLIKGYAKGVNKYIELHRDDLPDWVKPDFNGVDVHAAGVKIYNKGPVRKLVKSLDENAEDSIKNASAKDLTPWGNIAVNTPKENPDVGSNAWALAPGRSKSGNAILLRNPHLNWDAGYYEVQFQVDGLFNFYGDFRIGQPLGVVGGFNQNLGWATTNNSPRIEEVYAFDTDPDHPDKYCLDGKSHALVKKEVSVEFKLGDHTETIDRKFYSTSYGPVVHRTNDKVYIIKSTKDGEYRGDQQYLQMMKSKNLSQWKEAMRMQGLYNSNLTYADGDGNIFYVWNAAIPELPKQRDEDKPYIAATKSSDIWTDIYPWDKLPHLRNPEGGYIHNENDSFHFTNLNEMFDPDDFPKNFEEPRLDLRSQLSLKLIGGDDKLSLEDVVKRKNDLSMLLADRVKDDLIQAVQQSNPRRKVRRGLNQLKNWDNTVAKDSKGGILFQLWWDQYVKLAAKGHDAKPTPESAGFPAPAEGLFSKPWSGDNPVQTPRGLADKKRAVKAFKSAVQKTKEDYGKLNLKWGDVHRAKLGDYDYPVGGATGELGCFRVFWYKEDEEDDQKLDVVGGDGWVLAVEFDETPQAYSVLAYGESNKEESPYFANQLEMFVNKEMKEVSYTKDAIGDNTVKTYHPGEEND